MSTTPTAESKQRYAFICSRGTLDGAYPSMILSINAQRLGHQAHVFYTFMGINVVRPGFAEKLTVYPPGFLGAIPGMSWLATRMMRRQIEQAGIPDIAELLETAQLEGVKLVACRMTMDMMKLGKQDLIADVEVMNAEQFLKLAGTCSINLFT